MSDEVQEPSKKRSRTEEEGKGDASTIEKLPVEIWEKIFLGVDGQPQSGVKLNDLLVHLALSCSFFRDLIMNNNSLCKKIFEREINDSTRLAHYDTTPPPLQQQQRMCCEWLYYLKRELLLDANWAAGNCKVTVLNEKYQKERKAKKKKAKEENAQKGFGGFMHFRLAPKEAIEDIDVSTEFIVAFDSNTEITIYSAQTPYEELYRFVSKQNSFDRHKRLAIAYSSPEELTLVVAGPEICLWKVWKNSGTSFSICYLLFVVICLLLYAFLFVVSFFYFCCLLFVVCFWAF